jgi:TIGR03009 family protein
MTRMCLCAVALTALAACPLAAQTTSTPPKKPLSSSYTKGQPPAASQPPPRRSTYGPQPAGGPRAAAGGQVRPAGGQEPIREPQSGSPRGPQVEPGADLPQGGIRADAPPQPPPWFPLNAEAQELVDLILAKWEATSQKVHYYECKYQQWYFDPVFGPKEPDAPRYFAEGEIKYQFPDKGLLRDTKVWEKTAATGEQEESKPSQPPPGWRDALLQAGEHWVCDGISVFQFDSQNQRVVQTILPKAMQGKSIADGPLPFLFGAKAQSVKDRYWIRPLAPPAGAANEFWLEAVPRMRQDAQSFQKVHIVLDGRDFFPSMLSVYPPNHSPKNPVRRDYKFTARKAILKNDPRITLDQLTQWRRQFYEPKVPKGWRKEVQDMNETPPVAEGPQRPAPQATRPKSGVKTK